LIDELPLKRILQLTTAEVWENLKEKFVEEDGIFYNVRLEVEVKRRKDYAESRRQSRLKGDEDNVKIYLIKDMTTGYIKIGSSVNPMRRLAEMRNQKDPAITAGERDYKLIYESGVVERKEESRLHRYFKAKRIMGEWFALGQEDLKYICKTYEEQMNDSKKVLHLEYVYLLDEENKKLIKAMGKNTLKDYIERLDGYLGSNNKNQKKYTSHYHVILNWWRKDGKPVSRKDIDANNEREFKVKYGGEDEKKVADLISGVVGKMK